MANSSSPSDAAPSDQEAGPTVVTLPSLLVAAALLTAVFVSTNQALGLGIGRDVALSAVRCAVQLSALGLVLVPIFRTDFPPLSLAWALLMAAVAALEASARPALRYPQMRRHVFAAVLVAAFLTLFWGLLAVLRVGLAARYTIPLMGMFLGNTSGSVAVALTSITTALADGAAGVEARLAMGASRWEATRPALRAAVTLGLTPVINQMSIMGLVSVPGMMTGQILGGTAPALAARYQILVMYLIASSAAIAVSCAAVLAVHACTDSEHRLVAGALNRKPAGAADPWRAFTQRMASAAAGVRAWAARIMGRRRQGQQDQGAGTHEPLLDRDEDAA